MITFEHVSKTYPNGFQAVRDISMEVAGGETLVLLGTSGCGPASFQHSRTASDKRQSAGWQDLTTGHPSGMYRGSNSGLRFRLEWRLA